MDGLTDQRGLLTNGSSHTRNQILSG